MSPATARWNRSARCEDSPAGSARRAAGGSDLPGNGEVTFSTGRRDTVPKKSNYACGACGTVQDVLDDR